MLVNKNVYFNLEIISLKPGSMFLVIQIEV